MTPEKIDVALIGGDPAGLAAVTKVKEAGAIIIHNLLGTGTSGMGSRARWRCRKNNDTMP